MDKERIRIETGTYSAGKGTAKAKDTKIACSRDRTQKTHLPVWKALKMHWHVHLHNKRDQIYWSFMTTTDLQTTK